jgi:enoyl-CoA hydratase/carnithine racemase
MPNAPATPGAPTNATGGPGTATEPVRYERERAGAVSRISMDDGKVNVFSFAMLRALHDAFDRAEADETVVVLEGRPGCFSAGFDLGVLRTGTPDEVVALLRLGATLAERILSFPSPVVAACTGHAYPAGAFLLLAADVRIGADGPFALGLNEVRIGLTLPWFAVALARHRLTPPACDRAAVTGTLLDPSGAREAGLLDLVVPTEEVVPAALAAARDLEDVDRTAHAATKLRVRQQALAELRQVIETELA